MILDDGSLVYDVTPDPGRTFAITRRHAVNPVFGVACGLVGGAALFLIAVQALFRVPPNPVAVVVLVLAVVAYVVSLFLAWRASRRVRPFELTLDAHGVTGSPDAKAEQTPWELYRHWLETDGEWILIGRRTKGSKLVILPKEDVPADEWDEVRAIFKDSIDPDDEGIDEAFVLEGLDEK